MAVYRAAFDPDCPQRHWASEMRHDTLRLGNNRYRFGTKRMLVDGTMANGILVHVDIDHFNGGEKVRQLFFPWSELQKVTVSVRGRVLIEEEAEV